MAKEYFADNARFADLCNNILYGGREVILPEDLKERDTTEVLTALGLDKKTIAVQKLRDIFKNASIETTLTAHVYKAGAEVTGSALTALGTIKWYKDGGTTAVATGATLNISAGDVSNKATYVAQLEA